MDGRRDGKERVRELTGTAAGSLTRTWVKKQIE
jgi:hypothetical protein